MRSRKRRSGWPLPLHALNVVMPENITEITREIVDLFLKDPANSVLEDYHRDHLRACVCVSAEVHVFLCEHERSEYPSSEDNDVRYCIDSMRSVIDNIFSLHGLHHNLEASLPRRLSGKSVEGFASFRSEYMRSFEKLRKRT